VQVRDRYLLVLPVRVGRGARSVVDPVDALLGELRDGRPRLLRRDVRHELTQPLDERVRKRGRSRRRSVEDVELAVWDELAQTRLGLAARAARRVAEVELGRGQGRHDVLRDPAPDANRAQHLAVDEPLELDVQRLEPGERRQSVCECVNRVPAGPGPRRMRALPVEIDTRLNVPEAARVEDRVGRLEHDGELGALEHTALEDRRQRALVEGDLLAGEEDVARRCARQGELEHHRHAALHVTRAEPVHDAAGDSSREVVLGGHSVEVTGEGDLGGRVSPDDRIAVVVERLTR